MASASSGLLLLGLSVTASLTASHWRRPQGNGYPEGMDYPANSNGLTTIHDSVGLSIEERQRILRAHEDSLQLYWRLRGSKDTFIQQELQTALDILHNALRIYGPDQLFSSFNGGKDAVVVMHLLRAATAFYSSKAGVIYRPKFVYFAIAHEFPEVLQHIDEAAQLYCLNLIKYKNGISQGLVDHIKTLDAKSAPAFVLGTRRGDPNCGEQQAFSPSSWDPPFMRVNPILSWEYGHVWHFLRSFSLPYCCLYDKGFTSLGKVTDTFPNPALVKRPLRKSSYNLLQHVSSQHLDNNNENNNNNNSSGMNAEDDYWPAYMLSEWSLERAGRGSDNNNKAKNNKEEVEEVHEYEETLDNNSNNNNNKSVCCGLVLVVNGDNAYDTSSSNNNNNNNNSALLEEASKAEGVSLVKVVLVGSKDNDELVEEIRRLRLRVDILFVSFQNNNDNNNQTAASVFAAVATALGQPLTRNEDMLCYLQQTMATTATTIDVNFDRLSLLPQNAQVTFLLHQQQQQQQQQPIVQVENVFVVPGVPGFLSTSLSIVARHFLQEQNNNNSNNRVVTKRLLLQMQSSAVASLLATISAAKKSKQQQQDKQQQQGKQQQAVFSWYEYAADPATKTVVSVAGSSLVVVDEAVHLLVRSLSAQTQQQQQQQQAVLRIERVDVTLRLPTSPN